MRSEIIRFMEGYPKALSEPFINNPMGVLVRNDIPNALYSTGIINEQKYLITGSVGQGNWAKIPWICIFDRSITTSATRGIYIVYLLAEDGKTLYLTFNQGCTEIKEKYKKKKLVVEKLRENAAIIQGYVDHKDFKSDDGVYLGDNITDLGFYYGKGAILYKDYKISELPSEDELRVDLANMMDIYNQYAQYAIHHELKDDTHAYLLTWNPLYYAWDNYNAARDILALGNTYTQMWACQNTHVKIGDRVYMMRIGGGSQNGIIASGYCAKESYETDHWDPQKAADGKMAKRIDVKFDKMLKLDGNNYLSPGYCIM